MKQNFNLAINVKNHFIDFLSKLLRDGGSQYHLTAEKMIEYGSIPYRSNKPFVAVGGLDRGVS